MSEYEQYLQDMERLGASKPYMTEEKFNQLFATKRSKIIVLPANGKAKNIQPTLRTYKDD